MEFDLKIPELEAVPLEQRAGVYRQCVESVDFSRRSRRIRIGTLMGGVLGFLVTNHFLLWNGVFKSDVLNAIFMIGLLVFFIALMVVTQLWLYRRLIRNVVRNHARSLLDPARNLF